MAGQGWLRIVSTQEFLAGIFFAAAGVGGLLVGRAYDVGTAARMGPGYLPRILCFGLVAVGLAITLQALSKEARALARPQVRGLLLVPLSLMAFAALVGSWGLAVALPALLLIAGAAWRDFRLGETILVAAGLTVACILVFVHLLGLPVPILRHG